MKTIIMVNPEEYPKLKDTCEKTKEKDSTFEFEFVLGDRISYLFIYSSTKEQATSRGCWLKEIIKREFHRTENFKVMR